MGRASQEWPSPVWTWVRFEAPVACTLVCPYWLESSRLCVGDCERLTAFDECRNPFPPGSFDDLLLSIPPGADIFEFFLYPVNDWDSFLCTVDGSLVAIGANELGELCDNVTGANSPTPLGCRERIRVPVDHRMSPLVVRAFNFADVFPAHGRYRFIDLEAR